MNFNQLEMNVSIVATVTKLVKCTEHNFPANKQIPKSSFHEEFSISIDTTHTHLISHNKTQFLFFSFGCCVCVGFWSHWMSPNDDIVSLSFSTYCLEDFFFPLDKKNSKRLPHIFRWYWNGSTWFYVIPLLGFSLHSRCSFVVCIGFFFVGLSFAFIYTSYVQTKITIASNGRKSIATLCILVMIKRSD